MDAPQSQVYMKADSSRRRERRGVSNRSTIDEAKLRVSTIGLADLLCGPGGLHRVAERWAGCCPLPDHEDRSPSFTVYPETNSWFCYGCLRGGDVIELARFAWGYEKSDVAMAAAQLLYEFGHEIPARPESWHRRQSEKVLVQDGIQNVLAASYRRRWWRILEPMLDGAGEDEAREVWRALWPLARERAERRMVERGLN